MTSKYVIENTAAPVIMVRKDDQGNLIETEGDNVPYTNIPKGVYDLEITGFQAPFEVPRDSRFPREEWQSETVTKTRLEFTVLSGNLAGATFLGRYTLSVGDRANLGKLLRAITRKPIPRAWDMTTMIGLAFNATVVPAKDELGNVRTGRDGNPFPTISVDSVEPIDLPEIPEQLRSTPKPAPKPPVKPSLDMASDPRLSWSALNTFLKDYGFKNVSDFGNKASVDITDLGCAEVYELACAFVNHPAA